MNFQHLTHAIQETHNALFMQEIKPVNRCHTLRRDNPPIGILLYTGKDEALVEYALLGISNQLLFLSISLFYLTRQILSISWNKF